MAFKRRSTKQRTRETLPRRRKRQLKPKMARQFNRYVLKSSTRNIASMPNEVLLEIFSYFSPIERTCTIKPVCKRWMALTMEPTLWKDLQVESRVPTDVVKNWIKSAKFLKRFTMTNRNDADVIIGEVSKNCKQLESINVQNCRGSKDYSFIHCTPICNLVSRCPKLYNYNFSNSRFDSRKFFRLISRDKRHGKIMRKCNYVGPMNFYQKRILFFVLTGYRPACTEIDTASMDHNINDYFRHLQDRKIVDETYENWFNGTGIYQDSFYADI